MAILNRIRAEVKAVDPDQQVIGQTRDLEQWIQREDEYAYGRLVAALFTAFSALALALAAIGLFSVVSYSVAQRTNEFGVRMALGATPANVLKLVLASSAREVIVGVGCGILFSLLFTRISSRWAEGSVQNPLVFAGTTLLLMITAALAAVLPAPRAAAVDPMVALRYE
jgi:ABC-type antimicrobial peptide transport system permease subunit